MAAVESAELSGSTKPRRGYDGTLRRQRATETRERIISAAHDLLHQTSIRDWRALTVRAVAERAGVNERTVYRHFTNERGLRDAVMQRLEEDAGVDLSDLRLADIAGVTAKIFEHLSAYPLEGPPQLDATLSEAGERQRRALERAVAAEAPKWTEADRAVAAAMLDLLWSPAAYERLTGNWRFDEDDAVRGVTWVLELVAEAIRSGRRPA